MSILAKMALQIGADTTEMKRGLQNARQEISGFSKGAMALGGVMLAAFSAKAIINFGAESSKMADKQLKAEAKVKQAIESTAGAAGKSFEQLKKMASGLQDISLYNDEDILDGVTAQLLTFTNIANSEFDRTQKAVLDISTVLGTDLKGTSIQLGKALNDPVNGLSALSRSGIQFSDSQKDLIKNMVAVGDTAGAQRLILEELERQYGGQAEAAAKAGLGPLQQMQNAWGDVRESLGKMLIPVIADVATKLKELMPILTKGLKQGKDAIIDVINYFIDLYNESVIFRGAIEGIKLAFKTSFEYIKTQIKVLINYIKGFGKAVAYALNPKNWVSGFGDGLKKIISDSYKVIKEDVKTFGKETAENWKIAVENTLRKDKIPLISKETVEEANIIANNSGKEVAQSFNAGVKSVDLMADTQQKISEQFQIMEMKALAFGDSFDLVGEKQKLLKSSIEDLLESGFDPMSMGIQSLIEQMNALSVATVEYPETALTFEEVQMRIAENFKLMEDRALAFGESYNILGEKQSYLKDQIQYLLDEGYAPLSEEVQLLKGNMESLGQTTDQVYSDMIKNMEDAASAAFSNGESFKDAAKRIVKSLIAEGIAAIISKILKDKDIPPLLSIPLAAVGGKLAGGLFNKLVPKLAEGGLAYGPTMAVVGDNRGASSNPEVIAPLNKLKDYMGGNFDDSRIVQAIERMERVNVSVNSSGIDVQRGANRNSYLNRKLSFAF